MSLHVSLEVNGTKVSLHKMHACYACLSNNSVRSSSSCLFNTSRDKLTQPCCQTNREPSYSRGTTLRNTHNLPRTRSRHTNKCWHSVSLRQTCGKVVFSGYYSDNSLGGRCEKSPRGVFICACMCVSAWVVCYCKSPLFTC